MKIARIETFRVPPRWLFVRVETDDGIVGWGEPVLEGRARTVEAAVAEMSDVLIGADPLRIEHLWQTLTRGGFYRDGAVLSSAIAGIDQALWDIAGKDAGRPVHTLLGGHVRDRVRLYGWVYGGSPAELADAASAQRATGMTAVKMNGSEALGPIDTPATLDLLVERVAAVREAMGRDGDVAIDFHGRYSLPMARRSLSLLEPFAPMFIEEPVVPELTWRLRDVVEATSIPIAVGERLYSRGDMRTALDAGVAVLQPDLSHAGGISEVRRIASAAETYGAYLAPHCPLGPIALAACLQIDFAIPNFLIQEQSLGLNYAEGSSYLDYLVDRSGFDVVDGSVERPAAPGLGIEVDEDEVRRAAKIGHDWQSPRWHHPDGSLAEW
ncbi:galactonate dehydratase [Labedella endophytica]|uniref:Galactonate dehydratase n=1 Tax=Labedella endophytica TaxID=1523160 RepID=A0A3S0X166_9MICO|nr:galactonate dehydratase [Labedella endophytica]RUR03503.1 galactonate dehydratase [Labedella endophytica]